MAVNLQVKVLSSTSLTMLVIQLANIQQILEQITWYLALQDSCRLLCSFVSVFFGNV